MALDGGTYADLLEASYDDIPEEVLLPVGNYRLRVARATSYKAKPSEDKPAAAMFVYEIVEPGSDVDMAALEKVGGKLALKATEIIRNFQLKKPYDLKRLNDHIAKHGVKLVKGMTRKDAIEACKGAEIMAFVQPRSYDNREGVTVTQNDAAEFFVA